MQTHTHTRQQQQQTNRCQTSFSVRKNLTIPSINKTARIVCSVCQNAKVLFLLWLWTVNLCSDYKRLNQHILILLKASATTKIISLLFPNMPSFLTERQTWLLSGTTNFPSSLNEIRNRLPFLLLLGWNKKHVSSSITTNLLSLLVTRLLSFFRWLIYPKLNICVEKRSIHQFYLTYNF